MIQLLEDEVFFDATFNTLPQAAALHQTTQETLQRTIALARKRFLPHCTSCLLRQLVLIWIDGVE